MTDETLINIFWERVENSPYQTAILFKRNGKFISLPWQEHGAIVESLASSLLTTNISPGSKVAIMSSTKPHWTWCDIAILSTKAVTVPVYPSLNAEEAAYILNHCEAEAVFLENPGQVSKILSLDPLPSALRYAVLMEGQHESTSHRLPIYSWDEFILLGTPILKKNAKKVQSLVSTLNQKQLATIVYTSGTTGIPKGAMITHGNIHFVCQSLSTSVGFHPDDLALSFLPLSHIFERVVSQFLSIYEGLPLAYAESMDTIGENVLEIHPTVMNAVPRFYEKVYSRIMANIRRMPAAKQCLVRWALAIGKRASQSREKHNNTNLALAEKIYRTELRIADKLVFSKIRKRLGGRLRILTCGAAPLAFEVHRFFDSVGIPILEGYGLTETTAPVTFNRPGNSRIGTVGLPLPGVEVKIADDDEIMVKGANVFSGYYKNKEATAEAFRDGWLLTGDTGEIDNQGFLRIKGRKKDIIITAGGKHIAPLYLEKLLCNQSLIGRSLVYGDRRKYITALLTLNYDELANFAKAHNITFSSPEELSQHPKLIEAIKSEVTSVNRHLADFEQIKHFIILEKDFSIENNELTPTLKLKRQYVIEKYKDLLDSMYQKEDLLVEIS